MKCFYVCLLFLLVAGSQSSAQAQSAPVPTDPLPLQGWSPLPNLTICVQEGIELLSVIQYLGGQNANNTSSVYRTDVRRYFLPYRNHPAVVEMFNFDYRIYSDLVECGLTYDHFPDIRMKPLPDSSIWYKTFPKDTLTKYLTLCMQFYKDTHFHEFYLAHRPMFKDWADGLARSITEPIRIFDSLIDLGGQSHWLICMDPLNDWGAHTIMPDLVNSAYDGYYIYQLGYFGDKDSSGHMSFQADLYNFAWHEGTHAFTNPILEKYKASIDSISYMMKPSGPLKNQNIDDWGHYFNELLPRAVSIALSRQFRSQEEYEKLLDQEMNRRGFIHVKDVADLIYADFVHERKVKDFDALMPEILSMLKDKYPKNQTLP